MTTAEYADRIVKLIEARPSEIDLDRLIYEVYVRAKIAESRRDLAKGHWKLHDKVMEEMWRRLDSKSAGCYPSSAVTPDLTNPVRG